MKRKLQAFRERELEFNSNLLTHPNVVTREPEVEPEDGGHQVGRLPHPRVLHQVPRKRLKEDVTLDKKYLFKIMEQSWDR